MLKEKIVAAAYNYHGMIFTGSRHYRIIQDIAAVFGEGVINDKPKDDGFMTDRGRFVKRREARDIALAAGQITEEHRGVLYSEDLWGEPEVQRLAALASEIRIKNPNWVSAIAMAGGDVDKAFEEVFDLLVGRYTNPANSKSWVEKNKIYVANGVRQVIHERFSRFLRGETIHNHR